MFSTKKGQGLSLNVIIVAALALIVLVVLVVVFTGRVTIFEKGVSAASKTELVKMKITYGDCHPSAEDEVAFKTRFSAAESPAEEESATLDFKGRIDACKGSNSKEDCASGCVWS